MTRRERVIKAINHEETDIIPYQVNFTKEEHDKMVMYLNDPDYFKKIGVHLELATLSGPYTGFEVRPGYFKDEFGVVWDRTSVDKDIGMMVEILMKEPDIKLLKLPDIDEKKIHQLMQEVVDNGNDTFKVGRSSMAMFERAWSLRGMENLLIDMSQEPHFVEDLLDAILEFDLKILDIGLTYNIDAWYFGDDWGQQRPGLIMGPNYWRKLIKPRVAKLYERVRSAGKYVIQHSCGDNSLILPDLIEIGMNIYQTFQPEIYNIKKIKEEFGKDLSFWGAISTQKLLPCASPEEVRKKVIETMNILGKGGGYIAGPTHWVPNDVPPENIMAMIDVFKNQSKYLKTI